MTMDDDKKKLKRNRFQRHVQVLIWKCYLQRLRKWKVLLVQTLFAGALFLISIFTAKPVFMTPLQAQPEAPLSFNDICQMSSQTLIGYSPNVDPYNSIMAKAKSILNNITAMISAGNEEELDNKLYVLSKTTKISESVIYVIWNEKIGNIWDVSIKSSMMAKISAQTTYKNPHLRSGFLGMQLAVSHAILEHVNPHLPDYDFNLISMPLSPLMYKEDVHRVISMITLCFTAAFLPPVLETVALTVEETQSLFKRALLIRHVDFATVYIAWGVYAYMTVFPICVLASVTLIIIFRWIHLTFALLILLAYTSVMVMVALIISSFHSKVLIACIWNALFTFFQVFLAELLVQRAYISTTWSIAFVTYVLLPPIGLIHAFHEFALLQTGNEKDTYRTSFTILAWIFMNLIYFALLMLLQRTIGQENAIGGQVSWKSIIFKKMEDPSALRAIESPSGTERDKLQEVDELVAKAVSFTDVSKTIMNQKILTNINLDIYRGEFTMLFCEIIQEKMMVAVEDLLIGLSYPDTGTINVLGKISQPGENFMSEPYMMGYCHRSKVLLGDLTVEEHLTLFIDLCLWNEPNYYVSGFKYIRLRRLYSECDLNDVRTSYVRNLDIYYRAQLCWAIAMLLEPKVVIVPNFVDHPIFVAVIKDKIMKYRKYMSLIKVSFASIQLEYCDRLFIFDKKVLVFGGTPAYMFFKWGRDYRLRLTFKSGGDIDDRYISELLQHVADVGASVRAHSGSLLILKVPSSPTANVAKLVKNITENSRRFGITSFSLTLPDSEEVFRRAIYQSRTARHVRSSGPDTSKDALKKIADRPSWSRSKSSYEIMSHLRMFGWKYLSFHVYYRLYFIITIIAATGTGLLVGSTFSEALSRLDKSRSDSSIYGELLTVENLNTKTTLVLRTDDNYITRAIATAYVLSEKGTTKKQIQEVTYVALRQKESLTQYMVKRAIDAPHDYVFVYAYGIDITLRSGKLTVNALYSPLHRDQAAAARSVARVYMALLRHFSKSMDASIRVIDDPISLDMSLFMKEAAHPPLITLFFLTLTISHVTLLPSIEHGLPRHMQIHAMNFSPMRYWFFLYFCDLILYWILVVYITILIYSTIFIILPYGYFSFKELLVVPFLLIIYGLGCVPQAYLFSVGPRASLNSMTFVIVNVVFGEATIAAKLFYGNLLEYALVFMRMSPQFNMAYALVKINKVFLYNSECVLFKIKNLCDIETLHKCCAKCGVVESCYTRISYLSEDTGILIELVSIMVTAVVFMSLVLLWEYQMIQKLWKWFKMTWLDDEQKVEEMGPSGLMREKADVYDKLKQIQTKKCDKVDTFGEYLLSVNTSSKSSGYYKVRNVFFGVGKGEALAISGLKKHGRLDLVKILAGWKLPCSGAVYALSKWKSKWDPHKYASKVSLSCEHSPLPSWMTVYDALEMLAIFRGVPKQHVASEIWKYIQALKLQQYTDTQIFRIPMAHHMRLHFAAAVIAAPPVIIVDECTSFQNYSIRRAMYFILYHLRKRGHAILITCTSIESHMPITSRLGILLDGRLYDIDTVDNLVERYSQKGYTVVVHLKDEVDVIAMFANYFTHFVINDTSEVLVNVQVLDTDLTWTAVFEKMENLQNDNATVYSYIITVIPIDYIYNSIIINERGLEETGDIITCNCLKRFFTHKPKKIPTRDKIDVLIPYERKYGITQLKELPWSVIFNR